MAARGGGGFNWGMSQAPAQQQPTNISWLPPTPQQQQQHSQSQSNANPFDLLNSPAPAQKQAQATTAAPAPPQRDAFADLLSPSNMAPKPVCLVSFTPLTMIRRLPQNQQLV